MAEFKDDNEPAPPIAALAAFTLTTLVGAVVAHQVGATVINSDYSAMTERPVGDFIESSFNWLIFSIFAAAGFVAGCAAWAGSAVARQQWRTRRELHERHVAATGRPAAPPTSPIDPPYL